jgi:HlyD family secretion protein
VLKGTEPVAVTVTAGATDGRMTEVTSDTLQPGMAVITEQTAGSAR